MDRASHPERVFVGVVWMHRPAPDPGTADADVELDRAHAESRMLTRRVEEEARKVEDENEKVKYLTGDARRAQVETQRRCDEAEATAHGLDAVAALPRDAVEDDRGAAECAFAAARGLFPVYDRDRDATPWRWRSHVRETFAPWERSEGPCYARHLASRLWGGETHALHADAKTRFRRGWDDALLRELDAVEAEARAEAEAEAAAEAAEAAEGPAAGMTTTRARDRVFAGVVLTGRPPGILPIDPPEDDEADADADAEAPSRRSAPRRPFAVSVNGFGELLPRPGAREVRFGASRSVRAILPDPNFMFARAEALLVDAPADPHAPYLYCGEELSLAARLRTRGWEVRIPAFSGTSSDGGFPIKTRYWTRPETIRDDWAEDRRKGGLLYADGDPHAMGEPGWAARRSFLCLASVRRVRQLVGAPDPESATADAEDAVALAGAWGLGPAMDAEAFRETLGVDFEAGREGELAERARTGVIRAEVGGDSDATPKGPGGVPGGGCNLSPGGRKAAAAKKKTAEGCKSDAAKEAEDAAKAFGVSPADGMPLRWRGSAFKAEEHYAHGPPELV